MIMKKITSFLNDYEIKLHAIYVHGKNVNLF